MKLLYFYCLVFVLFSCDKQIEHIDENENSQKILRTNLQEAGEILLNQREILNYLEVANENVKIFPCEFLEDDNYFYFNFELYNEPIHVTVKHQIIAYKNSYIILAINEPIDKSFLKDSLSQKLIKDSLIVYEPNKYIQCEVPFINFIVCKNDTNKVGFYDLDTILKMRNVNPYEPIKEEKFFPDCK